MVAVLIQGTTLTEESVVLDVGCGTTNNTLLLQAATNARVAGLDLSLGMLKQARGKATSLSLIQSPAGNLPFVESSFDFLFMTEVIHHLPDYCASLLEAQRILRASGCICIVTQSHDQIAHRMTSRFFPATVAIDCARYPSIESIENALHSTGFSKISVSRYRFTPVRLGRDYLETVSRKGYSMLHKISESDYVRGLQDLKDALSNQEELSYAAGYTFVWAWK